MQFYAGHKKITDLDRINKILTKNPEAGAKVMKAYVENVPAGAVWNSKLKVAEMAVDFAFIDNSHMTVRQGHSDITGAAAPSEVLAQVLVQDQWSWS